MGKYNNNLEIDGTLSALEGTELNEVVVNSQLQTVLPKVQTNSTVLDLDRPIVYNYNENPSTELVYTLAPNPQLGSHNITWIETGLGQFPAVTGAVATASPDYSNSIRYKMHTVYNGFRTEYFFTEDDLLPPTSNNPLTEGLLASYPLDTDGSDISGNNYNATINGSPVFSTIDSRQGITFDGVDDQLLGSTEVVTALNGTDEFTVSAWVRKPTGSSADMGIFTFNTETYAQSSDDNPIGVGFRYDNVGGATGGTRVFRYQVMGVPAYETQTLSYEFDTWAHIIFTYKRNDFVNVYINGVLVTSTPDSAENLDKSIVANAFSFGRGNKGAGGALGFNNLNAADVRVFNIAKDGSAATAIFNDSNI